jgi:predicted butyrate kinase (DUF1464 family)
VSRPRVAGADPGTSSLDLLILEDGIVGEQVRFLPDQLQADPALPVRWLEERAPFDLIAGPSGYGLPLVRAADVTEEQLRLMSLVRPDEAGREQGVAGFTAMVRAFCDSALPVVFLPAVIHLPTVPPHRKFNRIDLGTPDKLCVAALALAARPQATFCVVELGSAFTACEVVQQGRIVAGRGGTCGAVGWQSGSAWDGEAAYWLGPLSKDDLFHGGASEVDPGMGRTWLRESLLETVAGLHAITAFDEIVLSGRLLECDAALAEVVTQDLLDLAKVTRLESLTAAWVKHAAQGAALLADGLAGGSYASLIETRALRQASGTVLDWLLAQRRFR